MKVKFLSNTSYQTFPITEDMIDIDENVLNQIGKTKQFKDGQIVDYVSNTNIILQISQLKQKLADTDYKAIKFAEGELSAEELSKINRWFGEYYTIHEQKYRRLHTLGKLTDEGKDPYNELINLYKEAEIKRARIQELERLLSDSTK